MPKATQLCFFGLALILAPLVASYFFAISSAKTVYHSSATNQHLTTTTLGTVPADLLLATSVQVEDITSTTSTIPPITTTYIYNGVTDANFNQRMAGLLSHVHWLIDRASIGGIRSNTVINTDRGFLDRQIERTADNANDSINSTRSELSADISEINERLLLAESTLSGLSIAAASTSVMAANLTLNGHWLSGDGDDEGVFVSGGGFVGIGTSTPTSRLSVLGNMYLTGAFQDGLNSAGTLGMVLQSTGTSTRWVATSTLGITGGGGVATFLALTDTVGSYTANRIMFTNSGGTTLTDSANFVFDGTNLGIGTTTPTTALSVVGDTTLDGDLTINDNVRIGGTIQASLMAPGRVLYSTAGSYLTDSGNFVFDGTNLGVGTSTPGSRLTVAGDFYLTGAFRDSSNASGTIGMVLQSTGAGTQWVATSTLGITGGGGGSLFTDGGATTYLTATGDNLAIGTTTATTRLTVDGSMNVTGNIDIPNTTSGAVGVLTMNGQRFLHGYDANNTPGENLFLGYRSGNFTLGSTTQPFAGVSNIGIGTDVLSALTEGSNNVAVGTAALANTTTGGSNTALGWFSMLANTTGAGNSAVGRSTLQSNTTGRFNSAFGNSAMEQNTEGENNVAIGAFALQSNTTGQDNVAVGRGALNANVSSWGSVAIGKDALLLSTVNNNTAIGREAGSTITTGEGNTIIGAFSGDGITTGAYNTIIGANVTGLSSSLSNNIIIADGQGNQRINVDSSGNVGIGTTTPTSRLTVAGDFYLTGALRDSTNASGTLGMVLQSTGTSTRWVATSTLGFTGGGGVTTFLALTDTPGSFTANRIPFTNSSANALTDSAAFVFDGTNLGIGTSTPNNRIQVLDLIQFNNAETRTQLGYQAGQNLVAAAINNTFVGYQAGFASSTASTNDADNNTGIGYQTLFSNTTGFSNSALGSSALYSNTEGIQNTAVGNSALYSTTIGTRNTAIGNFSLYSNTEGIRNTANGYVSLYSNTTGSFNSAVGDFVLYANTTGNYNSALGHQAGRYLTNGSSVASTTDYSVFLGTNTKALTADDQNTIVIGYDANGLGSNTVVLGNNSIVTTALKGNVGIGTTTPGSILTVDGNLRVTGGINFGAETVISHYSNNILFGSFALGNNVDGYRTIAVGDLAGNSFNTGFGNVFIGNDAANNLSTTSGSVVIGDLAAGANYGGTSGGDMVIVGSRAGYSLQSGGGNGVMIGAFAGENVTTGGGNILLGYRAGDNITDGYGNIVIGYDLDMPSASDFQKLNIGNLLFGTGIDGTGTTLSSGNIGIGTSTPSERLTVVGTIQSTNLLGGSTNLTTDASGNIIRDPSDARLKENVTTIKDALDTVLALRGVRYEWIDKERFGNQFEIGFLAQEVDPLVPEVVQKGGEYWSLNSKNLVAVVVEAIKEVWAKVLGHEERLVDLEAENAALKARLESVERELRIEDAPGTSTPPPVVEEESGDTETIEEPVEGTVEEDPEATTVVEPEPEEEEIIEEPVSEDVSVGEEG